MRYIFLEQITIYSNGVPSETALIYTPNDKWGLVLRMFKNMFLI